VNLKTSWLFFIAVLLIVANTVNGQAPKSRGRIITPASPTQNPLDPNGDGFIYKTQVPAGFSNDGYYVDEFEFKMFGIPKLEGDVEGDNQTGPKCGITDVIPDSKGYSVYALKDANNNLIFRFRLGDNASSIESWHILLDIDGLFGIGKDPNANDDNPGFEVDITLIKKQKPGIIISNIDGKKNCPAPFRKYPLSTNFQIAVADMVTCGNPDYFYDFFVPFSDIAAEFGITSNTGLRYAASTSSSATCSMEGSVSDIAGVDNNNPKYEGCHGNAFVDLINSQCPTAVAELCETCAGFNAGSLNPPGIDGSNRAGQTVITGTSKENTNVECYASRS